MNNDKCYVFNIQKFCVNDGPGIRTTVFLKGCMLNCLWCHNPESKSTKPQVMLNESRCIGCGACMKKCPNGLHNFDGRVHNFNRSECTVCGKCAESCVGALEICGKEMTVDEIMIEVMKDAAFYKNSGGGITVSGGEPLAHPQFTLTLLKAAKEAGLHTCIETCGYAKWEDIEAISAYVDIFLWDVKETDSSLHKKYTGVPNERILDNLRRLSGIGASIVLRCPIIPGYNDRAEHLTAIGELATELDGVDHIEVEPYHSLGSHKCTELGYEYKLSDVESPENDTVNAWIDTISSATSKEVKRA